MGVELSLRGNGEPSVFTLTNFGVVALPLSSTTEDGASNGLPFPLDLSAANVLSSMYSLAFRTG